MLRAGGSFVDRRHDHAVGGDADDEQSVVCRSTPVEVQAAVLDGDEPGDRRLAHRRAPAPVEADEVAGGEAGGGVAVLVDAELMDLRAAPGEHDDAVVRVPTPIEIV